MKTKIILIGLALLITISGILYLENKTTSTNTSTNRLEIPIRPQHIDERQWYRIQQRGGKIEPNKIIKGRDRIQKILSKEEYNYKDGGLADWNWRGPGNIGGRVRAITIKRNDFGDDRIIVGAAGGGIWTSTDDGSTWAAANDFFPSLAVTSFGASSNTSSTIYASTGEGIVASTMGLPGAGIFKSTNSGASWTQLASTANPEFYWVNKVAVNPSNSNHILAVTSVLVKNGNTPGGGKLKESTNGGSTWTDILSTPNFLTDVEFHPSNSNIRVVSGRGELFVYNFVTGIYDDKINQVNNYTGRIEVALAPSNQNYMYAQINTLIDASPEVRYRSNDGGASWVFVGGTPDVFNTN